jgi:pimeloyl-ACP methyl ester carboxylesterase
MTSDGVQLAAVFYDPGDSYLEPDILILVHEAYRDHRSWDDFRMAALDNGYAVIALDLRGHGQSMGDPVFDEALDRDIEAVLEWISASPDLRERGIAIVGASVGANLALRAGARHPQIGSLVLLSPGMSYWGIDVESAILEYDRRPVLLVSSEEDAYSATTVQRLGELGLGDDKVVIYPGAAHGTGMIRQQPDLIPLMVDWLEQTMD